MRLRLRHRWTGVLSCTSHATFRIYGCYVTLRFDFVTRLITFTFTHGYRMRLPFVCLTSSFTFTHTFHGNLPFVHYRLVTHVTRLRSCLFHRTTLAFTYPSSPFTYIYCHHYCHTRTFLYPLGLVTFVYYITSPYVTVPTVTTSSFPVTFVTVWINLVTSG